MRSVPLPDGEVHASRSRNSAGAGDERVGVVTAVDPEGDVVTVAFGPENGADAGCVSTSIAATPRRRPTRREPGTWSQSSR
jgi:hypothetical protein